MTAATLILLWLLSVGLLLYRYRTRLTALWREPMLRYPVLIFESDDWGPGPDSHASALLRLVQLLEGYRDRRGRHPVMTLGMILALPDSARMRREGLGAYRRLELGDPRFAPILEAIDAGVTAGVFALQLHGREHFWPPALMAAASDDAIRAWLTQEGLPDTEDLPAHLQSRWIDASSLPSAPLANRDIHDEARHEVATFSKLFGQPASVIVPPTFVWNLAVEQAWASAGVRFVVTPGQRNEQRDGTGAPVPVGNEIRNGEISPAGPIYLVRNDYFEPSFGHRAEKGLRALTENTRLGRPTLFETHRFNFTGAAYEAEDAFTEVRTLVSEALMRFPDLKFLSTQELAEHMQARSPELIEHRLAPRIHVWLARVYAVSRLRKLSWLTGLAVIGVVIFAMTRPRGRHANVS